VKAVIDGKELTRHTLILGSTGSGKTHTAAKLLERAEGYSRLVLDWHGEYSSLLDHATIINPYSAPIGLDIGDTYETVELFTEALELTSPQSYILSRVIESRRIDDIDELVRILEGLTDESSWMRESRLALIRKITPLARSGYRNLFRQESDIVDKFSTGSNGILIMDVSRIKDPLVRRVYSLMLLKTIFTKAISKKIRGRLLVCIEEAQNLLSRMNPASLIVRMLGEIRKFGVGLIIVSQSPTSIDEAAMKNTNTKIIHAVTSSQDLEELEKSIFMPRDTLRLLPYLEVGEAVLYSRHYKKPVIVRVE
jgi:DNA helicase HerA-like ATPase